MIRITQFFALIALALTFGAAPALAQPVVQVIANVNITAHNLTLNNNAVSGSFTAMTSYGNQDAIHYGFVWRNANGMLVAASQPLGTLALVQKVPKQQPVSYTLPAVPADSTVFLNLSNDAGMTLALLPLGEVKGSASSVCAATGTEIVCESSSSATLNLSFHEGGPQGKEAGTASRQIVAGKKLSLPIAELLKDMKAGNYLVAGAVVKENGSEQFAVEYTKTGSVANIRSVAIPDGTEGFSAVVYTTISGFGTSTSFTLGLDASGCGMPVQTPVSKTGITTLTFASSCETGTATVTLYKDNEPVDSQIMSFAVSPVVPPARPSSMMYTIAGALLLLLALLFLAIKRFIHHEEESVASVTPTSTPTPEPASAPSAASGAAKIALMVFAVSAMLVPMHTEAMTAGFSESVDFYFCTGAGCDATQYSGNVTVGTTVTFPDSVPAGSTYSISISQANYTTGQVSAHGGCRDSSSDSYDCDQYDVQTAYTVNGTSYFASHTASASRTFTAGSSGSIPVSARVAPYAPYSFGCKEQWQQPSIKCITAYEGTSSSGSASITIVPAAPPAPTVNVNFSFFERMFKVFALAN